MKPTLLLALTLAVGSGCASNHSSHYGQTSSAAAPRATTSAQPPRLLPGQPSYASPDEAVEALYAASTSRDLPAIARIVGLPESELVTPDPQKNASLAEFFQKHYDESHRISPEGDALAHVFIGHDNFPLASPLVRQDGRWFFDSAGGMEAMFQRYVAENEAATIGVCRAYVQAQYEYYAEDRDGDDVLEYAQQLGSTRGKRDGLYWHTEPDDRESPLGVLIADARAAGYLKGSAHKLDQPKPYHGYLFQVLTRQGASAPGGAHDYIINNHMIAGFALVAVPARYGTTGVMTFEVGANGKVYQKDLGPSAPDITDFNPDSTWTLVTE